MTRPAVFLDRDGVIICSRSGYVTSCAQVEALPGALDAIGRLCRAGHRVIVVTNQSPLGRGIMAWSELATIHQYLSSLIAPHGGEISRYFVCPHHPADHCSCRKPRPGLLLAARAELGVELATAFMVGDQFSDLEAAWAVGSRAVLVLSGETPAPSPAARGQYLLASDLSEAADLILSITQRKECPFWATW